jgi:hypothetical protein
MANSNCLIAFPNRSDAATLSGGSWQSGAPLTNVQTRFLSQYARSTGVGLVTPSPAIPDASQCSAVINVNFGQTRYVTAMALVKHNLTLSANVRLVLWTDPTQTVAAYDSGWQPAYPRFYDTVLLRWSDSNFLYGQMSLDDYGVLPAIFLQMISTPGTGAVSPQACQYASIYIQDPSNTAGYIQIGRLYMAEDWTPAHNFSFGASIGWQDPTVVDVALDGTEYYELRSKYREAIFTLNYMSISEGVNEALRICNNRGVSGDILFVWDPSNAELLQQRSFIGRLEELSPLQQTMRGITSMAFKIKELV